MNRAMMNNKQKIVIGVILAAAVLLAGLILLIDRPQATGDENEHGAHAHDAGQEDGHHDEADAPKRGPHGGRLFVEGDYGVEITIFEQGVEPEFRLYTSMDGKLLDPAASNIVVTLERLGRAPQPFTFVKENDYLKGNAVVEEPHSFKATIAAQHGSKSYRFDYEQIEARVTMNAAQLQQNGIEVQTAGPARISSTVRLIGEIHFNEDRRVQVVPRLAGIVESVRVNAGDRVRKGQVLAVIFSQALADQRSELLAAQQRLTLARTTYAREKMLWQEKISAEQDFLQARHAMQEAEIAAQSAQQKLAALGGEMMKTGAGSNLTRYEIRAPLDGTVTDKRIAIGEALKDDAPVFVVADLSTVWAEVTVYAKDLNTVKPGRKVTVSASAFDLTGSGTVSYVGALVGEETRAAKARVVLRNPQGLWRPGLLVNVDLLTDEIEVPVAVATDAIQTLNEQPTVFGRYGEVFEARPLELGRSDGKFTEVLKGLQAGEQYAAKNSFLLKADLGKAGASHDH